LVDAHSSATKGEFPHNDSDAFFKSFFSPANLVQKFTGYPTDDAMFETTKTKLYHTKKNSCHFYIICNILQYFIDYFAPFETITYYSEQFRTTKLCKWKLVIYTLGETMPL